MKQFQKLFNKFCGVVLFAALAGCGGGSGSGGGDTTPDDGDDAGNGTVTKTFTVSLEQVQVNRISTGEPIDVDTSDVSSSGSVTVSE